jgi:hypothetical protein
MQNEANAPRTARILTGTIATLLVAVLAFSIAPTTSAPSAAPVAFEIPSAAVAGAANTAVLQAAIDAAPAGSTVHLPAGLFIGQLTIHRNENLVGAGEGKTILQSPANMTPDALDNVFVVEVGHHATVDISHLTVRVTEQCMLANSIGVATGGGIGVGDNSTLNVWDVRAIAYGAYPGLNSACTTSAGNAGMLSFGRAISIGLDDAPGDGSNLRVEGHGTIQHVETRGFDIFSLSVGGVRGPTGSTATITDNTVRVGPGPYTAAYGIVVYGVSTVSDNTVTGVPGSDGGIAAVDTSADITGNTVANFTCTNAPFPIAPPCGVDPLYDDQDLGIFLAVITPGTVVSGNTIVDVDSGILIEGPGARAVVAHNSIANSTFYALELIDANQTFRADTIVGGMYAVAVGAGAANSTAVLEHDTVSGYSESLALLESNYPYVAKVVVRSG